MSRYGVLSREEWRPRRPQLRVHSTNQLGHIRFSGDKYINRLLLFKEMLLQLCDTFPVEAYRRLVTSRHFVNQPSPEVDLRKLKRDRFSIRQWLLVDRLALPHCQSRLKSSEHCAQRNSGIGVVYDDEATILYWLVDE